MLPVIFNRKIVLFFATILFISACSRDNLIEPPPPTSSDRGKIISSTLLSTYTTQQINAILAASQVSLPVTLNYTVQHVKIVYYTVDRHGNYIQVSGAFIYPINVSGNLPILSIQHGTVTKRDQVASVSPLNSFEGVEGLVMGSAGYAVCIPDYPGLGVSTTLHPYLHAKSLANASVDFIRAVKNYCAGNNITLNTQLFITGYSEGGYATMALHKEIEEFYSNEFTITASAPMAGPYDMTNTAKTILGYQTYSSPVNIAYIMVAYNNIYEWNYLGDIFQSPYYERILTLFNGTYTLSEINAQLSTAPDTLLQQRFINGIINGTDERTLSVLSANNLVNWRPNAPMRLYHGTGDEQVPYTNSTTAAENFMANGATAVEFVEVPNATHTSAAIPSITDMIEWFETKRTTVNKIIVSK